MKQLSCCNHLEYRHLNIADDGQPKQVICLTGFCRCGRPPVKVRPAQKKKQQTQQGSAFRQYKGYQPKMGEELDI